MAGRMAGQTINDRLLAAKHSIAGQGLAKSVCKATTEEMIGPKKKHLDYLVHCTNEPNVSIPQMANLLIERSQNANWIVVYKALVTVHHVMCYGNERFTQFLASSNSTFQLSNFLDKSGLQGYDMSPFIRRYARYLNEKALSYRTVAFDFCKVKRGKEDGLLRTMNADKLLRTLPVLQNQLDALLEFGAGPNDLTNGIINMCFMLLFRDLIRLFACYNDGIINLLEKYFDMNKKQCKEALDIYKKFLIRMDKVAEFLKVAETVGIDKGDIPDLTKAPSSLLDALEQHYHHMEGKKTSNSATITNNNQKNVKSGVSALSTTSNAFGNVVANGRFDYQSNGIDENLKLQALAEEEAAMNQFKSKVSISSLSSSTNDTNNAINNPFLSNSSSVNTLPSQQSVDLFAAEPIAIPVKASDDLLQLSNPFADTFSSIPSPITGFPAVVPQQNAWMPTANGNNFGVPQTPVIMGGNQSSIVSTHSTFVSDSNFASVFGNSEAQVSSGFDPLGGVLQPMNTNNNSSSAGHRMNGTNHMNMNNNSTSNNIHNNNNSVNGQQNGNTGGLLTGDLESSLASLAENLTISDRKQTLKGVQWNMPNKTSSKPNWSPQPMSATTGANYKPMNQSIVSPQLTQQPIYPQISPKKDTLFYKY